jgi:hypothetical protein
MASAISTGRTTWRTRASSSCRAATARGRNSRASRRSPPATARGWPSRTRALLSIWLRSLDIRPTLDFRFNYQTPFLTDPSVTVPFEDIRVFHFSSHRKPGTPAFMRWKSAGAEHGNLLALYARYRDMPMQLEGPSA